MNCTFTFKIFTLLVILGAVASTTWADPTVDGLFSPGNEYTSYQNGVYSRCYHYTAANGDFYIFNDWYNPDNNFDPMTFCDYNVFTWASPSDYRLLVRCGGGGWLQRWNGSNWVAASGTQQASNYTGTPMDGSPHPVWEIKIPNTQVNTSATVNQSDPKNGGDSDDNDECEDAFDTTALGFGGGVGVSP
ncbi:MAG TPA: hypothetical protein VMX13_15855 [Sedimentisphaerales bacterium]|nr:hypothetical protein [Sedimentisphaerales bacterium]